VRRRRNPDRETTQRDTNGDRNDAARRASYDIYSMLLKERIVFLGTAE
jgi:hypothetical protein